MQVPLMRLQCGVNSYDWGKIGNDSAAARFAAATPAEGLSIQSDQPYAEVRPLQLPTPQLSMLTPPAMDGHPPQEPLQGPHHRP